MRLYSVDAAGRRGVVFASLESERLAFVLGSRWAFGLQLHLVPDADRGTGGPGHLRQPSTFAGPCRSVPRIVVRVSGHGGARRPAGRLPDRTLGPARPALGAHELSARTPTRRGRCSRPSWSTSTTSCLPRPVSPGSRPDRRTPCCTRAASAPSSALARPATGRHRATRRWRRRRRPRPAAGTAARAPARRRRRGPGTGVMPPRWNGQPAPRIRHRSMSIGAATTPSASISPISSASAARARSRTCSAVLGRSPTVSSGLGLLARRTACRRRSSRRARSPGRRPGPAGWPRPGTGRRTRRAGSRRRAARPPVRPAAAARTGVIGSPSGRSAPSATSIGVPSSTAAKISPISRISSRLTTKPGRRATSTAFFFSVLATASAVATVASSVRLAPDDLQQRQHRHRVEEVEADDPLGWARSAAISVTDSEEVLVASTQVGRRRASRARRRPAS